MSRWEPVSDSIRKKELSDGCGRLMIWLVGILISLLILLGAWKIGNKPRCYACNHFRHENRMCGSMDQSMGTCICEKDKK